MTRLMHTKLLTALSFLVISCCANAQQGDEFEVRGTDGFSLAVQVIGQFEEPWAMTFLPDGRLLVTEKEGRIKLVAPEGNVLGEISGVPASEVIGQGGFADITLHPDFENNGRIYMSFLETEGELSGSVVEYATLALNDAGGEITDRKRIWTQLPKIDGGRHYSQRLLFDQEGYLFITSGDRGEQKPAQDMDGNLGKIIRLHDDGRIPADNPFVGEGGVQEQFWSIGHRNPLGLTLDAEGQIWEHEMGPRGGDELNRIVKGENYGWPVVSDGRNYSMLDIPDHDTRPDFKAPAISWVPSVSPSSIVIYDGDLFKGWNGNAVISTLSGTAIVRVSMVGEVATEEAQYYTPERLREIEQAPDGSLYVLEDGYEGRLLRVTPAPPKQEK